MKQILQNLKTGKTELAEIPVPRVTPGHLLIQTRASLISAGTERMLVNFGKASLLRKARQQPEKVRQVLEKVTTEGLFATLEAVRSKLDQPLPLGYCNVGEVAEIGDGVTGFSAGDRVVSNGHHAEFVRIPRNLCARIPDGVDDESAAFTVLASIGLQGIRLAQPALGERVAVIGLGLIGLLTVQLLQAQGCRVLGVDFDERRLQLAGAWGAQTVNLGKGEDPVRSALAFSDGHGMDAVLIAAATDSNDPVRQAARMSRKRGRIVLIGVTGLELNRADFYEKELTFQVSCSYGAGRYDPAYEEKGRDYPIGYVRWTENRNFQAVLELMKESRLQVAPLITHRFTLAEAGEAYRRLSEDRSALGIVLTYPQSARETPAVRRIPLAGGQKRPSGAAPAVAFIGAGNYASRVLLPAFQSAGVRLHTIVSSSGVSGVHHGTRKSFEFASTDVDDVLGDGSIDLVVIATRHDSHAELACRALEAGKDVFVEKPLALHLHDLDRIESVLEILAESGGGGRLMVGFNRRFSPLIGKMKELLDSVKAPRVFCYTCNAGWIPADHWTQDPAVGGGRIVGEACHFIDLVRYLAGSPVRSFHVSRLGGSTSSEEGADTAVIDLEFQNGSIATIQYLANGGKSFPKERLEVFAGGGVLQLNNFRSLSGYNWPGFKRMKLWKMDKGQTQCVHSFLKAVREGSDAPIPLEEIFEVSRISIELGKLHT